MSWISVWNAKGDRVVHDAEANASSSSARVMTSFLIEGTLWANPDKPVRIWAGQTGERAFQVYRMPNGALQFLHRGLSVQTDPDMFGPQDGFRIIYTASANPRESRIDLFNAMTLERRIITPYQGESHCLDDFLPSKPEFFKPMSVVAIADHNLSCGNLPAYGKGSPINTPVGPIAVEDLRPGMIIEGVVSGPSRVRWCGHVDVLGIGSMAPLLLRAPYFGLSRDVHVAPMTRMLMAGNEVEYLTGKERVFARMGDMINRVSVIRDQSQPVRRMYQIMTDDHDCLSIGRCNMETSLLGDILTARSDRLARPIEDDLEPVFETIDRATAQSLQAVQVEARRVAA